MAPEQRAVIVDRCQQSDRRASRATPAKAKLRALTPQPRAIDPEDLKSPGLYINRELSWLEFNQRVLAQALDSSHPLLERVKFLSIVATNLDEFYMIRVSTTLKKLKEGIEDVAPDGYDTAQQLYAMRERARRMLDDQAACWTALRPLLAAEDVLPRFVPLPESISPQKGLAFVFLEDVIRENVQELFLGTQVKGAHLFRIIRDADLEIEQDEADDLLETVDRSLKQLRRGALSLLQVESGMPPRVLNILAENFEIDDDVVLRTSHRLGFGDWMQLTKLHRPNLKDLPFSPRVIWRTDDAEVIFDELRYQDQLVHHPFDSFSSVESFLRAAVRDPHVIAIKMTLYRIGADSPLIDLLVEAAESASACGPLWDAFSNIRASTGSRMAATTRCTSEAPT